MTKTAVLASRSCVLVIVFPVYPPHDSCMMCARVSGMQTLIVPQLLRASFLLARSGSSTVDLAERTTLHCSLVLLIKMTGQARFSCSVHTAQSFQTTTDMSWISLDVLFQLCFMIHDASSRNAGKFYTVCSSREVALR